jgi:hypothetical protein
MRPVVGVPTKTGIHPMSARRIALHVQTGELNGATRPRPTGRVRSSSNSENVTVWSPRRATEVGWSLEYVPVIRRRIAPHRQPAPGVLAPARGQQPSRWKLNCVTARRLTSRVPDPRRPGLRHTHQAKWHNAPQPHGSDRRGGPTHSSSVGAVAPRCLTAGWRREDPHGGAGRSSAPLPPSSDLRKCAVWRNEGCS